MNEHNEIEDESNCGGSWEWFACDENGHIGCFNNAGLRHLPKTVKRDRLVAERLAAYLLEEIADRGGYSLRENVEVEFGGWEKIVDMDEFLRLYGGIARKGLYAHNTQHIYNAEAAGAAKRLGVFSPATQHIYDLDGSASYYLVTIPEQPLHLYDLPGEIAEMVARVRSPLPFGATTHFKESETMLW